MYSGHWARPWDIAGGGLMAANRAVWLEPPSEGEKWSRGQWVGGCVPPTVREGVTVPRMGTGIGWHDQGHKKEALSLGGRGRLAPEKSNLQGRGPLRECQPPNRVPTPFLLGGANTRICLDVSHSLFLPGLCAQDKGTCTA